MTLALPRTQMPESDSPSTLADIGERAGRLGVEIADIAGFISDLTSLGTIQTESARGAIAAVQQMAQTNDLLTGAVQEAKSSAETAQTELRENSDRVSSTLIGTAEKIGALGDRAATLKISIEHIGETIRQVQEASRTIKEIALQTQMLALNAGIESARAGSAGNGFAIIAAAVKSLADQIGKSASDNHNHLTQLERTIGSLSTEVESNATMATAAREESIKARDIVSNFAELTASVQKMMQDMDAMSTSFAKNTQSYGAMRGELKKLVDAVKSGNDKLGHAKARAESILEISEDFILFIAESGIETPDTPLIELCQETAQHIGKIFDAALNAGKLTMASLFDENYMPIPGSNPPQHMTGFVAFTDEALPPIQEPILSINSRITFCAAIDRNGYLPTHNRKYSHRQGPDPVWNAANCRNRRIFNDRTGLSAGQSTRPFLLQTYRRDMGGGNFILMKDASAPITVRGRHWGGFRIGFTV